MSTKIFTVNKFLGLNQSENGSTGLKLGEASNVENFYITDDQKLKTRPGTKVLADRSGIGKLVGIWQGVIGRRQWLMIIHGSAESNYCSIEFNTTDDHGAPISFGAPLLADFSQPIKIFTAGNKIYVCGTSTDLSLPISTMEIYSDAGNVTNRTQNVNYVPLAITGAAPSGGGDILEPLNILSDNARVQFSGDGEATEYTLPDMVSAVITTTVDGEIIDSFAYDPDTHIFTFNSAPAKGDNNVEFLCDVGNDDLAQARTKFLSMRHCEAYNGATDTRLFFYGDGTNICYYTGVPAHGDGLYIPIVNEIAVDSSASAITGMRRHYTRLMAYKTDGTFSINYEPITLEDGVVIAGFKVHPASREVGNDMDNQIQTVANFPRTLCGGTLYEWRHTASYYQDERYAKRIGEQVAETLRAADPAKIVTCDDDAARTYYMFLNDDAGTVLVNRYELDAWTVYTGEVFKNVRFADAFHGNMLFANDTTVYRFDADSAFDKMSENGDPIPIVSTWESGYMSFGADYLRKYSSTLWVSMLPEPSSKMSITVKTDRSDEYMVKSTGRPLFDFSAVDFSNFSFLINRAPKIQRIKLKIKKFVYYKLIFRVDSPGARATVLGYDQEVRYASKVK